MSMSVTQSQVDNLINAAQKLQIAEESLNQSKAALQNSQADLGRFRVEADQAKAKNEAALNALDTYQRTMDATKAELANQQRILADAKKQRSEANARLEVINARNPEMVARLKAMSQEERDTEVAAAKARLARINELKALKAQRDAERALKNPAVAVVAQQALQV